MLRTNLAPVWLVLWLGSPRLAAEESKAALSISGFVDGVYAYNSNRPADHANFFPGVGTSAKRDNEFSINLAQVDFAMAPEPVGFKLSLAYGTATEVVHAAEARGVAVSPDVWRHVVQASVQYQTEIGRGRLIEGGVYPSHIGFEGFATKDNWNYTRSWLGELSPYYQAGVKLAYPFGEHWSGQFYVLNGWQVISDNNRGKSLGWQLARSSDKLTLSFNGIVGPELANNDDEDGAISGIAQTLKEVTATLEHRPVERLIVKLEGRYDRSDASAFAGDEVDAEGAPLRERDQFLLLVGVVATF